MAKNSSLTSDHVVHARPTSCPTGQVTKQHPGKCETDTQPVMEKVVTRLETDRRWALARSVRALVAERDELREKLERSDAQRLYGSCQRFSLRKRTDGTHANNLTVGFLVRAPKFGVKAVDSLQDARSGRGNAGVDEQLAVAADQNGDITARSLNDSDCRAACEVRWASSRRSDGSYR